MAPQSNNQLHLDFLRNICDDCAGLLLLKQGRGLSELGELGVIEELQLFIYVCCWDVLLVIEGGVAYACAEAW